MASKRRQPRKGITAMLVLALGPMLGVVAFASPAHAGSPVCQQGGVQALWARGSGQPLSDSEARTFKSNVYYALQHAGIQQVTWAELGNLDGSVQVPEDGSGRLSPDEQNEYPAVPVDGWNALGVPLGTYSASVKTGATELINYLNSRYANGGCPTETMVIGAYSQGADAVGWAIQSYSNDDLPMLSPAAHDHIGYVALYGDPKRNPGDCSNRGWWDKGNASCSHNGVFHPRIPYVTTEFQGRFASWCDDGDNFCANRGDPAESGSGNHSTIYESYWIWQSAGTIAQGTVERHNRLDPAHPLAVPDPTQTTPPVSLYQGYVPDGMIVQDTTGHNLYVGAGGRLFWFDQNNVGLREALLTQRRQRYGEIPFLVMADEDIHAVEVNRDSSGNYVPGAHMPADNTFLYQYGSSTQYVIKFQHPFAIGDTNEVTALGGADRAIMVPTSISDLQQYPAQWVQNDLLQFYGDPSVWHYAGSTGFRVPSVPTRDCLSARWHRGVTLMPSSAWNSFPTNPTQQAACDFTHGQVLVGQPSQRQVVVLYGAGFAIGSPEEATAIGAANQAVPVTDETIDGLLARTPNIPQGHVFRAGLQTTAYHYVDRTFHPIGSPATRDCLLARGGLGTGEEVVPGSFIARYPQGAAAYCELENRLALASNGVTVGYIKDGYRRPVPNPAIRDCLVVRTGAGQPLQVSDNVWNSYTPGPNAYCPYETEPGLNFVQESGDSTVWLVHAGGTKQHVGSLCVPDPYTTQLKQYHVWTVPAGETAGHVQGADFWASGPGCQGLPQG